MYKPVSKSEIEKFGMPEPECIEVPYTYHRDGRKPTIDCWMPPKGWIFDHMKDRWVKVGIHRRSSSEKECYWQVDPRFDDYRNYWERWEYEEEERKRKNPLYKHPELNKVHNEPKFLKTPEDLSRFKSECWLYRLGGYWFYNYVKGKLEATYITGTFWTYLSAYKMDIGTPKYRKKDRLMLYYWQWNEENPFSYGMLFVDMRRGGKTFHSGNIALEKTTRIEQFHTGIQSKTEEDAKKSVFNKAVIKPFKKYPKFFKPVSNLPKGNTIPASGLIFNTGKMDNQSDELESFIDYKSSNAIAYDGEKLNFGIYDEEGKSLEVNVYDRWLISKYCYRDDEGKVIGKSFHTTTVEEMESGGKAFLKLWRESNHEELFNNTTKTGLFPYFSPSYKARHIDRYGECDEEANKLEIMSEWEAYRDNPKALSSAKRKEPFYEEDAFMTDATSCVFDPIKLNDRLNDLLFDRPRYKKGNLHWKDGIRFGEVIFIENSNGRFMVMEEPPEEIRNGVKKTGDKYYPINTHFAVAGIDTFDHRILEKDSVKGMSLGAIAVLKKDDMLFKTDLNNGIICLYVARPEPNVFYEDNLLCMWWYGILGLAETNKPGLLHYLEDCDCDGFIPYLPDSNKRGIATTAVTNTYIGELTEQYISDYIHLVWYIIVIENWLEFSPADTTAYDVAMAVGFALILLKAGFGKTRQQKAQTTKSAADYFSFVRRTVLRKIND